MFQIVTFKNLYVQVKRMETTLELSSRAIYLVRAFKTHTHEQWTILAFELCEGLLVGNLDLA